MNSRSCTLAGYTLLAALGMSSGVLLRAAAGDESLYDRLGGQPAVQAVANGLVDRILVDQRVNTWFASTASSEANTATYKAKLFTFICQSTGGPCHYTGRDMIAAHRGRAVTSAAFDAVVQDLVSVLESLKVPEKETGQLLEILGPLKASIVQDRSPVQPGSKP